MRMLTLVKCCPCFLCRVTDNDFWWLVVISSTTGCAKYLQLIIIGWKSSTAIFNLYSNNIGRMRLPMTLAIHYLLWLFFLVSMPLAALLGSLGRYRTGTQAGGKEGWLSILESDARATKWFRYRGFCLDTSFISQMETPEHRHFEECAGAHSTS